MRANASWRYRNDALKPETVKLSRYAQERDRPVIVGACPRSGTTLLRTMLNSHPEIGVPRETHPGERRVALTPPLAAQLVAAKLEVRVESGAGQAAGFPDAGYREKGRFKITDQGLPSWAHPVVSGGRLYIRNQTTLAAYDIRSR